MGITVVARSANEERPVNRDNNNNKICWVEEIKQNKDGAYGMHERETRRAHKILVGKTL